MVFGVCIKISTRNGLENAVEKMKMPMEKKT